MKWDFPLGATLMCSLLLLSPLVLQEQTLLPPLQPDSDTTGMSAN